MKEFAIFDSLSIKFNDQNVAPTRTNRLVVRRLECRLEQNEIALCGPLPHRKKPRSGRLRKGEARNAHPYRRESGRENAGKRQNLGRGRRGTRGTRNSHSEDPASPKYCTTVRDYRDAPPALLDHGIRERGRIIRLHRVAVARKREGRGTILPLDHIRR